MTEDHSARGEQLKQQQLEAEQRRQAAERDSSGSGSAAQDGGDKGGESSTEPGKSAGQLEKDEAMKKARQNPQTNAQDFERKGVREVFDPVTGRQVQIKDADLADFQKPQLFDPEHIDPAKSDKPGPALNRPGSGAPLDKITPNPVEPTNLNLYTFPPPVDPSSLKSIVGTINGYAFAVIGALGVIWFFTAWRGSWAAFFFRTQLIGGIAVAIFFAHGIVIRKIEKELESIRLNMHKQRGEEHSPPTPERCVSRPFFLSLQALRAQHARGGKRGTNLTDALFPLPQHRVAQRLRQGRLAPHQPRALHVGRRHGRGRHPGFASGCVPLSPTRTSFKSRTDSSHARTSSSSSLPRSSSRRLVLAPPRISGFVDAVKIEDFTLGNNAFRILNMRALPDQPSDKEYPREEWIDQGDREAALDPNRRIKSDEQKEKEKQDKADAVLKEETPEDEVRSPLSPRPAFPSLGRASARHTARCRSCAARAARVDAAVVACRTRPATTSTTRSASPSASSLSPISVSRLLDDVLIFPSTSCSFAPPGEAKSHNKNISLIMKFFLGAYDLFHLPVPIWIAVESVVGTVRLRCQMVSEAPFIRNVTFTLMGVPAVEAVRPALPLLLSLGPPCSH